MRDRAKLSVHLRRLYAEGALSAVEAGEEMAPASEYRALQHQLRELHRLLGETFEKEVLRDALDLAQPKKRMLRSPLPAWDDLP
jgi:transposase